VALALVLVACGQSAAGSAGSGSAPGGTRTFTLPSGGHQRTFLVFTPPGGGSRARPLVLVYHGADDTATHQVSLTDFKRVARTRDEIVVYLQGYRDTWNEGAGHTPAHQAGINDVAFTQAVLRFVEAHYSIDRRRIAAAGISNGALLTELLGCRLAADLTYVVPVEGQLPVSVSPGCRPARPISVLEVHGTADTVIPYHGGHFVGVGGGTSVLSAPASAARWAALDRCHGPTRSRHSGSSTFDVQRGCASGVTVTLDTIHGGQHVWPPNIGVLVANALQAHPARRPAARP
jgi:polyhydroxybutyrate depolymerase